MPGQKARSGRLYCCHRESERLYRTRACTLATNAAPANSGLEVDPPRRGFALRNQPLRMETFTVGYMAFEIVVWIDVNVS